MADEYIYFHTDSARLSNGSAVFLRELALQLAGNASVYTRMIVAGHSDTRHTNPHNDQLARDRADSVAQALLDGGVPAKRVDVRYRGEVEPADEEFLVVGRARNRRVEVRFEGVREPERLRNMLNRARSRSTFPQTRDTATKGNRPTDARNKK